MSLVKCVRIGPLTNFIGMASCAAGILLCTAGCRDAGKIIGADPPPVAALNGRD